MTRTLWKCILLVSGGLFWCMIASGGDRTRPVAERSCLPRSERATFLVRQMPSDFVEVEGVSEVAVDSGVRLSEWL
jgi:hypothetical protein